MTQMMRTSMAESLAVLGQGLRLNRADSVFFDGDFFKTKLWRFISPYISRPPSNEPPALAQRSILHMAANVLHCFSETRCLGWAAIYLSKTLFIIWWEFIFYSKGDPNRKNTKTKGPQKQYHQEHCWEKGQIRVHADHLRWEDQS